MTVLVALAVLTGATPLDRTPVAQVFGAEQGECFATGTCPAPSPRGGPPAGLMFVSLGLVAAGAGALRAEGRWGSPPA